MDALSSALSGTTLASVGSGSNGVNGSGSNGAGGSGPSVGRGATRGRRDRAEEFFLTTRPQALQSKQGEGGTEVTLASNYLELISKPNWRLLQYRVDMKPDIEHTGTRKAMLGAHRERLPKYIFDGTIMYSTTRLSIVIH